MPKRTGDTGFIVSLIAPDDDDTSVIAPWLWGAGVVVLVFVVAAHLRSPLRSPPASVPFERRRSTPVEKPSVLRPEQGLTEVLVRGRSVYLANCVLCHGEIGNGEGRFAMGLNPRPRDFRRAKFKFATTQNLVPSDEDLLRLLRQGIPGTTMPSFARMNPDDMSAVVAFVRKLIADGFAADLELGAVDGSHSLDDARDMLRARTTPGPAIVVPPETPVDDSRLANGKRVYDAACVKCHGAAGEPDTSLVLLDEDGQRNIPRRFAMGFFKGGEEGRLLWIRVARGMPGTPMPAFEGTYSGDDLWDVVHYVQRLCRKADAQP